MLRRRRRQLHYTVAMSMNLICCYCLRSVTYTPAGTCDLTEWYDSWTVGGRLHVARFVRCNMCCTSMGRIGTAMHVGVDIAIRACTPTYGRLGAFHGSVFVPTLESSPAMCEIKDADAYISLIGSGRVCMSLNIDAPAKPCSDFISFVPIDVPLYLTRRPAPEGNIRCTTESTVDVDPLGQNASAT